MPTSVSHGLVALVFGEIFIRSKTTKFWILSFLCAAIADIDIITVFFDINPDSMIGHRGFTHSLLFAVLFAFMVVHFGYRNFGLFSRDWWIFYTYFLALGISHIVLDAMTSGGQGIGFFIPFDSGRYLFQFRPIRVSPLRLMRFFTSDGKRILISEMFWIWVPVALTFVTVRFVRLRKNKK
jgi:inner membrane protein